MISNRRHVLGSLAALPLAGMAACAGMSGAGARRLRITLSGQALMEHPLCADRYPGLDALVAELERGDVTFTDLEVAIQTPRSGAPTRDTGFQHAASPAVLDCLSAMGFDLLALSNNHAWDLGTAGVVATREEVLASGFAAAGTGVNIEAATAPAFIQAGGSRVALVSMATEKIRDGAAATADRPGVNELRLGPDGGPHPDDAARNLAAIDGASRDADVVIAYHHNHDWGDDMSVTRPWSRTWARACIDAGAGLYVSHGAPLLHGIEIYRGRPLFFGLGSLVFHSRTDVGHYPPEVWETAIVHCMFANDRLESVEIVPVCLNERGDDPSRHLETRGRPRIAQGADAGRILGRVAGLSAAFGTTVSAAGPVGVITL
jgi:poly-gamma-glutamate capsule biosynthesis protein CapA/YwtB (metallophosphatase superfamily)